MTTRVVSHDDDRPRWEIRAIKWLTRRLRDQGDFKLRLGHSLVLEQPEPELYMEIIYGDEEVVVFNMGFSPETWPKIRNTMFELQLQLEAEYEEVKDD